MNNLLFGGVEGDGLTLVAHDVSGDGMRVDLAGRLSLVPDISIVFLMRAIPSPPMLEEGQQFRDRLLARCARATLTANMLEEGQ